MNNGSRFLPFEGYQKKGGGIVLDREVDEEFVLFFLRISERTRISFRTCGTMILVFG